MLLERPAARIVDEDVDVDAPPVVVRLTPARFRRLIAAAAAAEARPAPPPPRPAVPSYAA